MDQSRDLSERTSFDLVSDDALLLHEFSHRILNQLASAIAVMHLVKAAPGKGRSDLIDQAIGHFAALAELHRVLARPVRPTVDAAKDLASVCRTIAASSFGSQDSVVILRAPELWLPGCLARRLVVVAAELIGNAVKHALHGRAGSLAVALDMVGEDVVLTVSDDGPGIAAVSARSGTGLGSGIVKQFVERAGGSIGIESGPVGTMVRVALPVETASPIDDTVGF